MPRPLERLLPDEPLPPYTYVPGVFPHPRSDPAGHSYQASEAGESEQSLIDYRVSRRYLFGFDLFNAGYYWEAHEAWEALWLVAKARVAFQVETNFLKGLIKLAAAGVKLRTGNASGAIRHAVRAKQLFEEVISSHVSALWGVELGEPIAVANLIERRGKELAQQGANLRDPQPLLAPLRPIV